VRQVSVAGFQISAGSVPVEDVRLRSVDPPTAITDPSASTTRLWL
jgi:hypothetical protein